MWQLLRSSLIPRLRGNVSLLPCGLGTRLIQVMPLSGIKRDKVKRGNSGHSLTSTSLLKHSAKSTQRRAC